MSLWYCKEHGLVGPEACCPKAEYATITQVIGPQRPLELWEEAAINDFTQKELSEKLES